MDRAKTQKPRRVVVTGLGVVSSLGIGWEPFWKNLMAGKSGISRVEAFDTGQYDRHLAGEVKDFDPTKFMSKRKAARFGRASQMAIVASKLAVNDAMISYDILREKLTAVCIGTTTGEIQILEKFDDVELTNSRKVISRKIVPLYPSSSLSSNVALELKLKGVNVVFATACASGNYALGYACDLIRTGRSDFALAGGVDAFSRIVFTGFNRLVAVAPEKCQPFDKNRKGMIPGEGAGMLFVESMDTALKRHAEIYAEVLGYGLSCDGSNMTISDPEGIKKAIRRSLAEAKVKAEDVNYISAHGTGTIENDKAECDAIREIFNKLPRPPVSSIKSMLGHTMGAASALESVACCLAIKKGEIPPTINYEEPDSGCAIDCVPNVGRKHSIKIALNNSQAFGGNNGGVVLREVGNC